MPVPSAQLLADVRRIVAFERAALGGGAPEVAARIQEKLQRRLAPVIGEGGHEALFSRALTLVRAGPLAPPPLDELRALATGQPPAAPDELVVEVLDNYLALLAGFIGEALARRLLSNAWPDALAPERTNGEDS